MASIIEEFDSQSCKKPRKDGGSPIVKTIKNYFSPMPKPAEKPFSPPRSNNIMDYFSRKSAPSKEKISSPDHSKENCQQSNSTEKPNNSESRKQLSQKGRRKSSKAARKLVTSETVTSSEDASIIIIEDLVESISSAADVVSSCGIQDSGTATLLAQRCAVAEGLSKKNATKKDIDELAEKSKDGTEPKPAAISNDLSPIRDEGKKIKPARNPRRKKQQQGVKLSEPQEKEPPSSVCDVGMEVCEEEASQLNSSTVTISFEDFVRSQSQETEEDRQDEQIKEDECKITADTEEVNSDKLGISKDKENVGAEEQPVQISPQTVTVQAQVHVSPQQERAKSVGKLASIFNCRKPVISSSETISSSLFEAEHQPSSALTPKHKSNVVLQEEDLELAVIESESSPKCSEAERKQFMAAFKQPTLDGSKTKTVKGQSKQKQSGENISTSADIAEEDVSVPHAEQVYQENKAPKKKPARQARRTIEEEKEAVASSPAAVEETVTKTTECDVKMEEPEITLNSSNPPVRRSTRGTVVKKMLQTTARSPVRKTRRQNESKDADAMTLTQGSPVLVSTPKTRKSKYGVYQSQITCPPDEKESPIRIKLTRTNKNVLTSKIESVSGEGSAPKNKASVESKKRKHANKLVEKAKVIQQSKKATEEKSTLRRSSRTEANIKKSYCEDEDSVICVEEDQTTTAQNEVSKKKLQKPLRSLNDVLGKGTPPSKDTKSVPGAKVTTGNTARKTSTVISIFDESSHEGTENSQDDEQFRARIEFLKSGLPESLKKQIAKTAATKEVYSLSCASFQPVTHTMQLQNDCSFRNLPWPESSLLSHLKEFWVQTVNHCVSISGSLHVTTTPARRGFCERTSGWRPELSENIRQILMGEFSITNPHFPAQMFISRFLKRRTDHQQQFTSSDPEAVSRPSTPARQTEPVGGKRKRTEDERENKAKSTKKQRSSSSEEKKPKIDPQSTKRGGRRRSWRSRPEGEEVIKPSLHSAPVPDEDDCVCITDDLPFREDTEKKDLVKEDVLWTDKYQPQHSSDIIGNTDSVKRLHSWLKEWKLRADREERKKQKDKKQEEDGYDSDWDCGEENSRDGEEMLCNTMLITGPTGVGKTASVYACAQELGFKVFEVNASSQRSGRLILSQLKEATQSHQVDSQGVSAHKPSNFMSSSGGSSVRQGSSPRKGNSPRSMVSSPKKHPQSPRSAKRGHLAPTSLANFFKPISKEPASTLKSEQTAASKKVIKANGGGSTQTDLTVTSPTAVTFKEKSCKEQSKKMATSLILFEEVDVIFEDDSGFLAAIKTFMATTKRPVILTTSDPAFSSMFDGNFEEIHFKTPSVLDVGSYLQLLCLAEDMRTDPTDIMSLLRLNSCDIRQSLLQLQLWTRSAGGRQLSKPLEKMSKNVELKADIEEAADDTVTAPLSLPPFDTGCTESKLGLLNIEPERDIWDLLKGQNLVEDMICWELLMDSKRRGVDLLYSNMQTLLPLPHTLLTTSNHKPEQSVSVSQDQASVTENKEPASSCVQMSELADCSDSSSPVKVSRRMKNNKRRHHLPDQDGLQTDSESEDGFLSMCKPLGTPEKNCEVKESLDSEKMKRKLLTPKERLKSLPVSECLESVADFLDDMSYLDSALIFHPNRVVRHRRMTPVGAVTKDGMTDESGVETDRSSLLTQECFLKIQSAVEALSFHKCWASVGKAWDKAQQLEGELSREATAELSLPVAAHQKGYSFTQDCPCPPQMVQQRREVMKNLMLKGAFGTVANRPAAAVDYLPIIRAICRSEQLKEQGKVKRSSSVPTTSADQRRYSRRLQILCRTAPQGRRDLLTADSEDV
ncbi:ATPase family AAA domain-containing protein 5 [Pholidichthys leucotaenia]